MAPSSTAGAIDGVRLRVQEHLVGAWIENVHFGHEPATPGATWPADSAIEAVKEGADLHLRGPVRRARHLARHDLAIDQLDRLAVFEQSCDLGYGAATTWVGRAHSCKYGTGEGRAMGRAASRDAPGRVRATYVYSVDGDLVEVVVEPARPRRRNDRFCFFGRNDQDTGRK